MADGNYRQLLCVACGTSFTKPRRDGRKHKMCDPCREEKLTRPRPTFTKPCAVCGTEFTAKVSFAMYCSKRCCKAAYKERDPARALKQQREKKTREMERDPYRRTLAINGILRVLRKMLKARRAAQHTDVLADRASTPCRTCGKPVGDGYLGRPLKYCSKTCRDGGEVTQAIRRKAGAVHRYALRASTIERFDPMVVFERDGWRCQICGVSTPKSRRGTNHHNAPELDHVVPISRNGEHSIANSQCACKRCNRWKSNKIIVGQLPLFNIDRGNIISATF